MVKAEDITGRPVAISLYWYDGDNEDYNQIKVVCGATTEPLRIKPGTGVHALVTAGDGCPGAVSTPTRGKITFTWTYDKPVKPKR